MDSITYNKLEYITSGSGLATEELNQIVDLMDEYAREHVTEALRIHSVMRGGDSENQFVQHVNKYFKVAYLDKTPNTPTELLGNEAVAKGVSVEMCSCGAIGVTTRHGIDQCEECGKPA